VHVVGGTEGEEHVAGIVATRRAAAADTDGRAARKLLKLAREKRQIGADDANDGAAFLGQIGKAVVGHRLPNRHTKYVEPWPYTVVRLHQGAQVITGAVDIEAPRRRAGPALELVADHAGATAHIALRYRPA